MLSYFKTILSKVSFDSSLFEKELRKAIKALVKEELNLLREWCYREFGQSHEDALQRCFISA